MADNMITVRVRSQNEASPGFREIGRDADTLASRVSRASTDMARAQQRVEQATKDLARAQAEYGDDSEQARRAADRLGQAQADAARDARKLEQAQREVSDATRETGDAAGRAGSKTSVFSGGLGKIGSAAGKGAAGLLALVGAVAGLDKVLDSVADRLDVNARLTAQLGNLPAQQIEAAAKAASEVYLDAWGESLGQVNDVVRRVMLDMDTTSQEAMRDATERVIALGEAFDVEFTEITRGAGQLLRTGLAKDANEALDLVARGFQLGLDKSGDFMDSLEEYSTQWRSLGLDADTALGLMAQGLRAGARNSDIVTDAIKEFAIEAVAGSDKIIEGMRHLGLNSKQLIEDLGAGGPRAAAALDTVLDSLRAIEDPVQRNAIAVELFGTKAEDLGNALYALDPSEAANLMRGFGDSAKEVVDNLGDNPRAKIEAFKRTLSSMITDKAIQAFEWLEDMFERMKPTLSAMADDLLPVLRDGFDELRAVWEEMQEQGLDEDLEVLAKAIGGALFVALMGAVQAFRIVATVMHRGAEAAGTARRGFITVRDAISSLISRIRRIPGETSAALGSLYQRLTGPFRDAIGAIQSWLSGLRARINDALSLAGRLNPFSGRFGFAHGGIVGAASGGPRSGWTMVGENGPELAQLPPGTRVLSNPDTRRMLSGASDSGVSRLVVEWVGGNAGDEFLAWLRKNIRIRGGVTAALGA